GRIWSRPTAGTTDGEEVSMINSGGYYNGPAVEWARRNLAAPVKIKSLLSSRSRQIYLYALVFCLPGAFFLFGLILLTLGVKAKDGAGAFFLFGFLMLFPCGLTALLVVYVRRGFVESLAAE